MSAVAATTLSGPPEPRAVSSAAHYAAQRRPRAAIGLGAAVAVSVALGGCSPLGDTARTVRALERAGYTHVEVAPFGGSHGHLQVKATPSSSEGGPEGQANQAAGIVWTVFPMRFDHLTVAVGTPQGRVAQVYAYADMGQTFGPRDPSLDKRAMSDEVDAVAIKATAFLVAAWILVAGGSTVAAVRVVRRRRSRRRAEAVAAATVVATTDDLGP